MESTRPTSPPPPPAAAKAPAAAAAPTLTMVPPPAARLLGSILQRKANLSEDALQAAASLEAIATHPIAQAVVDANAREPLQVSNFETLTGRGVKGVIDGVEWHLGNHRLAEDQGVCNAALEKILEGLEVEGKTAMVLASRGAAMPDPKTTNTVPAKNRPSWIGEKPRPSIRTRGVPVNIANNAPMNRPMAPAGAIKRRSVSRPPYPRRTAPSLIETPLSGRWVSPTYRR